MPNPDLVKQFGGKLLNIYTGGVLTKLIDVGYQLGIFEASTGGPATSQELADRAGLKERYVREWLGAMATSGIYSYDPGTQRYTLPEEHAALLTGDTALNGCPTSRLVNHFGGHLPKLGPGPHSRFYGYDIAEDGIEAARAEAGKMGLTNAEFEVVDVTHLPAEPKFDLITAFDAIHDQKSPDVVLRGIHRALAPQGKFLMVEFKLSSRVEENVNNPFAPFYYGISLMHCMPVSLAVGGEGLGAAWGEQTARRFLGDAGFRAVEVVDTPRPQNYIFVCSH